VKRFESENMILWDVSGVLFKSDTWRLSFFEVGWGACAAYLLIDRKSIDHLKCILFDDLLFRLQVNDCPLQAARMPDGSQMSPMMMAWLKGMVSGYELIDQLGTLVHQLDQEKYFKSKRERNLVLKLIRIVFDPAVISQYTKPIKPGLALLKESQIKGNRNGIVSNWDSLSFDYLNQTEQGKSVFSIVHSNDIFISGKYGLIKPESTFFQRILEQCHVDPSKCFFIDDQPENIEAAAECGINGHCLADGDYGRLRNILLEHGYL
jgi:FMN phosphatase YigB (HAD superfamily)